MIILGLTGGIGMGKTTTAGFFKKLGVPVFNSDDAVHYILRNNKNVIAKISKEFPDAVKKGLVDKKILGSLVFNNMPKLKLLEKIIHPQVRALESKFVKHNSMLGKHLILLDIPLLFETHSNKRIDYIYTVSAPRFLQRQRVLKRQNMTPEKFAGILARQIKDEKRRKLSHKIIPTGLGKGAAFVEIKKSLHHIGKIKSKWPSIYLRNLHA